MDGNCYSILLTPSNVSICKVNNVIKMNPGKYYFNQIPRDPKPSFDSVS